ncbi:MAG: Kelch repeat-containing protein [Planctomycetota bacterium]
MRRHPLPSVRTSPRRPLLTATLAVAMTAATGIAQNLDLDKVGGALGANLTLPIQGQPNEAYALLFDIQETPTALPQLGITLDISDQFAWFTQGAPGWLGSTDANGDATPGIVVPNLPFLSDFVLSFQAIGGSTGAWRVSNLVRVTLQSGGSFVPALNAPAVPIAGGGVVAQDNAEFLFVGGSGPAAQRYLSRTEEWELAGATFGVGLLSQSTVLDDGRVLFTGGLDLATGQPTDAAAIYDPATQVTTQLTMSSARAGHGSSLLGNGRVLVSGGLLAFDINNPLSLLTGIQNTTEIFDPTTDTFVAGPNMLEARALHTSTTLTDGRVLIAGGVTLLPIVNIPTVSSTAYLFNPNNNSFGLPSFFPGARLLHSATALDNGRVLLCGGLSLDLTAFLQSGNIQDIVVATRDDCLVFTPGFFGTFASVPGMQVGRAGAALAPLPNGGALIAGGFQLTLDLATNTFVAEATETADVFSQGPNTVAPTGSMAAARLFPVTSNLPDGTILILGGGPLEAEIYQR